MKRIKNICLLLLSTLFLSSCSLKSGDEVGRETYSLIIDHALGNNKDDLINLFAKNIYSAINDFESQIDQLLNYLTGSYISFEYYPATGTDTYYQNFKRIRFVYNVASELYTTESKYFLSLLCCSADEYDSNNVGIWNLMVQKCDNENDDFIPYDSYDEWLNGDTYRGITLI